MDRRVKKPFVLLVSFNFICFIRLNVLFQLVVFTFEKIGESRFWRVLWPSLGQHRLSWEKLRLSVSFRALGDSHFSKCIVAERDDYRTLSMRMHGYKPCVAELVITSRHCSEVAARDLNASMGMGATAICRDAHALEPELLRRVIRIGL